jgi:hypothetical protein
MGKISSVNFNNFSLVYGGPLNRLLIRTGLIKPDSPQIIRKVVFAFFITWVPLLILSVIQGLAYGSQVRVPFLYDIAAHVRFLLALPLLIIAEGVIDPRTKAIGMQFINSNLVREEEIKGFESAVNGVIRLRNSAIVEFTLLGAVIFFAVTGSLKLELTSNISTWQVLISESGEGYALAGWWNHYVSKPIFQFLLLRWLWRFIIWSHFLWNISRLNLLLIPTHPDMVGGLGFLGSGQEKFGLIAFALSAVLSAVLADQILFEGAQLKSFQTTIAGYVVLILAFFLSPLFVFSPTLLKVKRNGLLEYGALATGYTQSFDKKWVRGNAPKDETLLGSSDIQSLADLGNSFEIVRKMRLVPFGLMTIRSLTVAAVIPFLPLVLTAIPAEEIVVKIIKFLL